MRCNIYAEELTDRIEIVEKEGFTGVRFYLELPVTKEMPHGGQQIHRGPFIHKPGDDDSSAVTFWGRKPVRELLMKAIEVIDAHHANKAMAQPHHGHESER